MHFPRVTFVDETAALVVLARRGELATAAIAVPALVVEIEVQVLREADPLHARPLSSQNAVAELVDLEVPGWRNNERRAAGDDDCRSAEPMSGGQLLRLVHGSPHVVAVENDRALADLRSGDIRRQIGRASCRERV